MAPKSARKLPVTLRRRGDEARTRILDAALDSFGNMTTFIETFMRMSAHYPQMHRIMTMQSNQGTERLKRVIGHFLREQFTMICDLIRRGQREGSVRHADPARLYCLIIGAGGTPFTVATEYQALTGRDVFGETEILRNIAFILDIVLR